MPCIGKTTFLNSLLSSHGIGYIQVDKLVLDEYKNKFEVSSMCSSNIFVSESEYLDLLSCDRLFILHMKRLAIAANNLLFKAINNHNGNIVVIEMSSFLYAFMNSRFCTVYLSCPQDVHVSRLRQRWNSNGAGARWIAHRYYLISSMVYRYFQLDRKFCISSELDELCDWMQSQ